MVHFLVPPGTYAVTFVAMGWSTQLSYLFSVEDEPKLHQRYGNSAGGDKRR